MGQFIFILAIIVFFSPLILDYARDSTSGIFFSSIAQPLAERGIMKEGAGDIFIVEGEEMSLAPLGLMAQGIYDVSDFAIDPNVKNGFFAGTREGSVLYKYKIDSNPWFVLEGSEFLRRMKYSVHKIVVAANDARRLFALVSNHREHGILYSSDRGVSFQSLYTLPKNEEVTALVLLSGESDMIVAGTKMGLIVKSRDLGVSWKNWGRLEGEIASLVSLGDERIAALTKEGTVFLLSKKRDGVHERVFPRGGEGQAILIVPTGNPAMFFVATRERMYKTENGGATFKPLSFPVTIGKDARISSAAVSKGPKGALYVGVKSLLLKSNDGGETWVVRNMNVEDIEKILIDPEDAGRAYLLARQ